LDPDFFVKGGVSQLRLAAKLWL